MHWDGQPDESHVKYIIIPNQQRALYYYYLHYANYGDDEDYLVGFKLGPQQTKLILTEFDYLVDLQV